jgi:sugar transferase (PEP-CTERM/EpsH1 system associated)
MNNTQQNREPLLYICHRIPFPPNKGDKITTYNLLKFLSARYNVHLLCFIDDPYDRQYIKELDQYCASVFCYDICERSQLQSGLLALLTGEAVSIQHYKYHVVQQWVDNTIATFNINKFFIYSSAMTQFVDQARYAQAIKVLDMADIDSDKWRQYAENKPWYSRWIYAREQKKLAQHEQQALASFDYVTLITEAEATLFKQLSPSSYHHKIKTLPNGVDTAYFDPNASFDTTDLPELSTPAICFTGAMDYWANEDAVVWFCQQVWPLILKQHPQCTFYIVGGKPSDNVKKLAEIQGVKVTGRVPDVRPYLASSVLAVAPMRIARGVQNKVLEAMAMAKLVVMTSMGLEGIEVDETQQALVEDDPIKMAAKINQLISENRSSYQPNRDWIIQRYSWQGALAQLPTMLTEQQRNTL